MKLPATPEGFARTILDTCPDNVTALFFSHLEAFSWKTALRPDIPFLCMEYTAPSSSYAGNRIMLFEFRFGNALQNIHDPNEGPPRMVRKFHVHPRVVAPSRELRDCIRQIVSGAWGGVFVPESMTGRSFYACELGEPLV